MYSEKNHPYGHRHTVQYLVLFPVALLSLAFVGLNSAHDVNEAVELLAANMHLLCRSGWCDTPQNKASATEHVLTGRSFEEERTDSREPRPIDNDLQYIMAHVPLVWQDNAKSPECYFLRSSDPSQEK